ELQVSTALVFLGTVSGAQTGVIAGLGDFRTIALLSVARALILCGGLVGGIWTAGLMGGVIGLVLTEAVGVVGNQLALRSIAPEVRGAGSDRRLSWEEFVSVGTFSLLALLSSLVTAPVLWLNNVMLVNQPDGFAALGIFNAAERWRQMLLFLPVAVSP